jgi:hypothetical protein
VISSALTDFHPTRDRADDKQHVALDVQLAFEEVALQ